MDNLGNNGTPNIDKPIPFDNGDKPIPLGNAPAPGSPSVSRAPLTLGGGGGKPPAAAAPKHSAAAAPRPPAARPTPPASPAPVRRAPVEAPASSGQRIVGVKTFFTKLHPGALEFMDEQINSWLKEHPEVYIKHTNITTGDVQAKKTEPNVIITVWYC